MKNIEARVSGFIRNYHGQEAFHCTPELAAAFAVLSTGNLKTPFATIIIPAGEVMAGDVLHEHNTARPLGIVTRGVLGIERELAANLLTVGDSGRVIVERYEFPEAFASVTRIPEEMVIGRPSARAFMPATPNTPMPAMGPQRTERKRIAMALLLGIWEQSNRRPRKAMDQRPTLRNRLKAWRGL